MTIVLLFYMSMVKRANRQEQKKQEQLQICIRTMSKKYEK